MSAILKLFSPDAGADRSGPGVGELIDQYLRHLEARVAVGDYSAASLARVRRYLMSFAAFQSAGVVVADVPPDECSQLLFTSWLTANLDRWSKGSTRLDAMGSVLSCFNWLAEQSLLMPNPFHRPKNIQAVKVPRTPMEPSHYVAVMRQAMASGTRHRGSRPLRRALMFLWRTGARTCEMFAVQWHDIRWDECVIRLDRHKTFHKTGRARQIPFGPKVRRLLRRLYERRQPGQDYVFLNNSGTPWDKDTWSRHFARYARPAGVPKDVTAYCTRHGFAVSLVKKGIATKSISDVMGHADTRMVERVYAHATSAETQHLKAVADLAEKKSR